MRSTALHIVDDEYSHGCQDGRKGEEEEDIEHVLFCHKTLLFLLRSEVLACGIEDVEVDVVVKVGGDFLPHGSVNDAELLAYHSHPLRYGDGMRMGDECHLHWHGVAVGWGSKEGCGYVGYGGIDGFVVGVKEAEGLQGIVQGSLMVTSG